MTRENTQSFRNELLAWFKKNKRSLPFRQTKDPYHVWLSEIMLQQTTMSAVLPYFERFLKKLPNVKAVALASEEELLKLWQGLGYYSRVRNFQKACQEILDEHAGKIPESFDELKKLKGIGDYTAAAISSICFDEQKAVVDGNVKRVLARVFHYKKDILSSQAKTYFQEVTSELLDPRNPGTFNEALMELGALVCRPKKPTCLICPLQKLCQASKGNPEALPVKKKQSFIEVSYHSLLVIKSGKVLLKKPSEKNLIRNMWELPSHYDQNTSPETTWHSLFQTKPHGLKKLGKVMHAITNKKITNHIYQIKPLALKSREHRYMTKNDLSQIPINTVSRKILSKFIEE